MSLQTLFSSTYPIQNYFYQNNLKRTISNIYKLLVLWKQNFKLHLALTNSLQ